MDEKAQKRRRDDDISIDRPMESQLEDLLDFCCRNERVCPHPLEWERLWKMIRERRQAGVRWSPPRPLILAAWWETTGREKRLCLQEHIRWAYEHEIFEKVDSFIRKLSEEQWYHSPKN